MAEEPRTEQPKAEPPKVTLNGNGKPPTSRTPAGEPGASPAGVPPKLKIDTARLKSETTRISLSEAQPAALELPGHEAIKRTTMRIEPAAPAPSAGGSPSKQTTRIDLSDGVAAEAAQGPEVPRRVTARIELGGGQAPASTATQAKKITARIDLTAAKPAGAEPSVEAVKKMTARIEMPGPTAAAVPPLPSPAQGPVPRTIKIKQPGAATVVLKRTPDLAPTGELDESRKSETARIELPAENIVEQPVTRRKTIRIKRPDAGLEPAAHTVTITREGEPTEGTAVAEAGLTLAVGEEEPGALYALMAMAATVIVLVLIYVLAAQTFAPDLPFIGKVWAAAG
ncbi:MAG: hypothetical protein NTV49_00245 [Kiritimatiellaeota bacterium]|nr:hypothetical protein [Kiritimatiellota bacterium]